MYQDGTTASQIWRGWRFDRESTDFGENVWYLEPGSRGEDKFEPRWDEGIWLRIADKTGEMMLGTSEGVVKVRDVRSEEVGKA